MTEAEKKVVRDQKELNLERLEKTFAPLFLGQQCSMLGTECVGPRCMHFLRETDGQKIIGGNCTWNVIAQTIAMLPGALQGAGQPQSGQMERLIVPGQH